MAMARIATARMERLFFFIAMLDSRAGRPLSKYRWNLARVIHWHEGARDSKWVTVWRRARSDVGSAR